MALRTNRWNVAREPSDGFRVLVCRYRPRALPKAKETWDVWWPKLGPSPELFDQFFGKKGHTPLTVAEYHARYHAEMQAPEPRALIEQLAARVARGDDVMLLCSRDCILPQLCHRTVLAQLVEAGVRKSE